MNELRFADLAVGQTAELEFQISNELVSSFVAITGDANPLHTDVEFAKRRGFDGIVAHGMLLGSFVSTLVGVHLPGKNALLHGVKLGFHQPVQVGDVVRLRGEVTHLSDAHRQAELRVTFTNQNGVRVARGTVQVGVHE